MTGVRDLAELVGSADVIGAQSGDGAARSASAQESFERGKFRVRGDCIEIWPSYEEFAYRVELWGDEVDQLALINPTRVSRANTSAEISRI